MTNASFHTKNIFNVIRVFSVIDIDRREEYELSLSHAAYFPNKNKTTFWFLLRFSFSLSLFFCMIRERSAAKSEFHSIESEISR